MQSKTTLSKGRDVFTTFRTSALKYGLIYTPTGRDYMRISRAMEMCPAAPASTLFEEAMYDLVRIEGRAVDEHVLNEMSVDDTLYLIEVINILFTPTPQRQ